ncbi:MAG TPA: hypothetical protein VK862_09685 [Afifellaceae bacterium]|nr:hypothetical protein [Afifellaceae bacterium]
MISRLVLIAIIGIGSALVLGYGPRIAATETGIRAIGDMKAAGDAGPLDGMEFVGKLGPEGRPKDVEDRFVFSDGKFVSMECKLRCDYPARPYFISETENGTEFVSNTKCPYKDAEIIWHGTVNDGRVSGTATWTIRRWYWTVTNTFEFEGELNKKPEHIASGI